MNATENNKIIADFMANKKGQIIYVKHLNAWFDDSMGYKYDKDYNWLMEVVDKIESLGCFIQIDSICVTISKEDINILTVNNRSRIKAVYNACLDFIKWYNEQQKN